MVAGLFASLRLRQWLKNLLVLAAPAAAGVLDSRWPAVVAATAVFCAASSAVYLANDVADAAVDRAHPAKSKRPVASGVLPVSVALVASFLLAAAALVGAALIDSGAAWIIFAYLVVHAAYSLGAKHVAVLDVMMVASGFVLRAAAGAAAADVPVSSWFIAVVAFAALAVAAGKRASELVRAGDGGRAVLRDYTPGFLAQVQTLGAGGALVAYVLWAFELSGGDGSLAIELSVVPFALALLRYLLLSAHGRTEAPEDVIFSDRVLAAAGVVWVVLFAVGIGW
jgi:decaprenyl-phosphate phosphoribosyltransferase